jgi:hypothetical protein
MPQSYPTARSGSSHPQRSDHSPADSLVIGHTKYRRCTRAGCVRWFVDAEAEWCERCRQSAKASRASRLVDGRCPRCPDECEPGRKACAACLASQATIARQRRARRKDRPAPISYTSCGVEPVDPRACVELPDRTACDARNGWQLRFNAHSEPVWGALLQSISDHWSVYDTVCATGPDDPALERQRWVLSYGAGRG